MQADTLLLASSVTSATTDSGVSLMSSAAAAAVVTAGGAGAAAATPGGSSAVSAATHSGALFSPAATPVSTSSRISDFGGVSPRITEEEEDDDEEEESDEIAPGEEGLESPTKASKSKRQRRRRRRRQGEDDQDEEDVPLDKAVSDLRGQLEELARRSLDFEAGLRAEAAEATPGDAEDTPDLVSFTLFLIPLLFNLILSPMVD